MIKLESGNIAALHLGGQKIARAYLGDALVFDGVPAPAMYTVAVSIDPEGGGTVIGAGQYREGETVTLKVVPGDGYEFAGWRENGEIVNTEAEYTFVVTGNRALVAALKVFSLVWTVFDTPISNSSLAFGNGVFVSASSQNYINYSHDGKSWSSISKGSSLLFTDTAFGNGKIIILGKYLVSGTTYRQAVLYSSDGINWTQKNNVPSSSSASFVGLDFVNGKFFAFLAKTSYYYSADGITWTSKSTLPSGPNYWYSVAYGNGIYVAVSGTNKVAYSADGDSWTVPDTTMPSDGTWESIVYGNGKFIAVNSSTFSSSYARAAISADGKTWSAITLPANNSCKKVIFAHGMFFIPDYKIARVYYSKDGENWETSVIPADSSNQTQWRSIAYGSGKLVVTRTGSKAAAYADIG